MKKNENSYKKSGVNISLANELVSHISRLSKKNDKKKKGVNKKDVIGKWHNVLLNVNWTDQEDGKIKLWLNEKLIYQKLGKSISKIVRNKKNN